MSASARHLQTLPIEEDDDTIAAALADLSGEHNGVPSLGNSKDYSYVKQLITTNPTGRWIT